MLRYLLTPVALTLSALDAVCELVLGITPAATVVDGVGPWATVDEIPL